jgi:hypothetical protein
MILPTNIIVHIIYIYTNTAPKVSKSGIKVMHIYTRGFLKLQTPCHSAHYKVYLGLTGRSWIRFLNNMETVLSEKVE